MYYEKDGDEVVQHRSQPDVVTLPDYEILQVSIITNFYIKYTIDFNFIYMIIIMKAINISREERR